MSPTIRCLLPIDGSPFTQRAVDFLLQRLAWWRELPQVDLLHVEPPVGTALARSYLSREVLDAYYAEQSEAVLAPAQSALAASGLQVRPYHLVGDAAGRITQFALEHEADLIVMGSHGHTALGSVALGSVATKVLASCRVPVLIVR
jgi:nucleotide-binding universal stress UspA family protein